MTDLVPGTPEYNKKFVEEYWELPVSCEKEEDGTEVIRDASGRVVWEAPTKVTVDLSWKIILGSCFLEHVTKCVNEHDALLADRARLERLGQVFFEASDACFTGDYDNPIWKAIDELRGVGKAAMKEDSDDEGPACWGGFR